MVHDVGLLDHATAISPELIVLTDEVIDMVKVAMGGIEVTDESLALDLIDEVGPGGHYLTQDHTLMHFRDFWVPSILDRSMLSAIPEGENPLHCEDRLREKTLRIMHEHQPEPLPEDVLSEIQRVEASWFEALGLDYAYPE
jgi:trimethylamine--corrinoid protein Co-methyltransferase